MHVCNICEIINLADARKKLKYKETKETMKENLSEYLGWGEELNDNKQESD